jgi:multicomponent Na+:H+ antiporter subunit E
MSETERPRGAPRPPADAPRRAGNPSALPGFLIIVGFLMLIWLGFSSKRDLFHLASGLGASVLVAVLTHRVLAIGVRRNRRGRLVFRYIFDFRWHRLLIFIPWMLLKIAAANVQVAYLILHPKMPISPAIIRVRTGLYGRVSRTALGTIITLTPGTVVLDIVGDEFVIHKIDKASAADILSGEMLEMVRKTFELEDADEEEPTRA